MRQDSGQGPEGGGRLGLELPTSRRVRTISVILSYLVRRTLFCWPQDAHVAAIQRGHEATIIPRPQALSRRADITPPLLTPKITENPVSAKVCFLKLLCL